MFPVNALPALTTPETHRIWAQDQWGDYLIYRLYPSTKVFIDGRSDFYGDDFGEEYLRVLDVQEGWDKTLDRYGIDTVVISPKLALSSTLKVSRDWRVVYDDHYAIVFRRNSPETRSLASDGEGSGRDRVITRSNRDRRITQPQFRKKTKEEEDKTKMKNFIMRFLKDEEGQDLIEYTLLMAFIALASAAIFISAGSSVNKIWTTASTQLSSAASTSAS